MTATSISANRLRMITSQYSAPAVEAAAFDPIAPGGVDHFAYDLSADAGAAQMIETTWTCTFDAGESDAVDTEDVAGAKRRYPRVGFDELVLVASWREADRDHQCHGEDGDRDQQREPLGRRAL